MPMLWILLVSLVHANQSEIEAPWQGPYLVDFSQQMCQNALASFYDANEHLCGRYYLPPAEEQTDSLLLAIKSHSAKLCGDPSLAVGFEKRDCSANAKCTVLKGYKKCELSFLQDWLDGVRFKMQCPDRQAEARLQGVYPRNTASCVAPGTAVSTAVDVDSFNALSEQFNRLFNPDRLAGRTPRQRGTSSTMSNETPAGPGRGSPHTAHETLDMVSVSLSPSS